MTNDFEKLLRQRLQPDVAIADLAAVVLEADRALLADFLVERAAGHLVERAVVDDRLAVLDDGDLALGRHLAVVVDARRVEGDVVGLPLFWRFVGVLARGNDAIEGAAGT